MSRKFPPVSMIGVPTDVGAGDRGARLGPDAQHVPALVLEGLAQWRRAVTSAAPAR